MCVLADSLHLCTYHIRVLASIHLPAPLQLKPPQRIRPSAGISVGRYRVPVGTLLAGLPGYSDLGDKQVLVKSRPKGEASGDAGGANCRTAAEPSRDVSQEAEAVPRDAGGAHSRAAAASRDAGVDGQETTVASRDAQMSRDDDNDDEPTQTTTATDANTKGVTTDATASVIGMRDLPWSKKLPRTPTDHTAAKSWPRTTRSSAG